MLTLSLNRACLAVLAGHTSLVGQLQLRGDTLVTWSLLKMAPIHRREAAGRPLTSLQFHQNRIISGSSDGRVRVWDCSTGELIRELGDRSDTVWQVHMSDSMAVIIRSGAKKLLLEVKDPLSSTAAVTDTR
jgi:WD40 repeat protein